MMVYKNKPTLQSKLGVKSKATLQKYTTILNIKRGLLLPHSVQDMSSEQNLKNISFGQFSDQLLGYANQTFSTLHHKFLKEIWGDNKTTNKLHNNQCFTNWQDGTYEVYIPTRDSLEYNLSYYRIAIKIQELNSNDSKHAEAYQLMNHIKEPLGAVESELLILIAPHQDRWGLVRGFKHRKVPGYFTAVFTNTSPEIVWKRVLDHVGNFIQKRLDGIMKALELPVWLWKWAQNKTSEWNHTEGQPYHHIFVDGHSETVTPPKNERHHSLEDKYLLYYRILENYSLVIRQSVLTFFEFYRHIRRQMVEVLKEIGIGNTVKQAIKPLLGLNHAELQRVFNGIRANLQISLMESMQPCAGDPNLAHLELLARR
jgi:hypothetical protein